MARSGCAVLNEMFRPGVGEVRQTLPSRLDGRACEDIKDSRASRKLHVNRKLLPQTKAGAAGFGLALSVVRACHLQGWQSRRLFSFPCAYERAAACLFDFVLRLWNDKK